MLLRYLQYFECTSGVCFLPLVNYCVVAYGMRAPSVYFVAYGTNTLVKPRYLFLSAVLLCGYGVRVPYLKLIASAGGMA